MKRYCTLAILGLFMAGTTAAVGQPGPNAGGVLLIHTDDTVVYTTDQATYDNLSGVECNLDFDCPPYDPPCNYLAANPTSGRPALDPVVWWVLAAWHPESCPRLAGITFGATWDSDTDITLLGWGHCGEFELANADWPTFLGSGTAVTFFPIRSGQVTEVYWFAGYAYTDGPEEFILGPHPGQGGNFGDDTIPSVIDPIAGYGKLGLGGAVGINPGPVPTIETSWGQIKAIFGNE